MYSKLQVWVDKHHFGYFVKKENKSAMTKNEITIKIVFPTAYQIKIIEEGAFCYLNVVLI